MNVKELIESLILDLANNNDIVAISRKAQVVASLLGNDNFSNWINKEFVNGYQQDDLLPRYRNISAIEVKATYIMPHGFGAIKYSNVAIPVQNLGKEKYDKIMNTCVYETLSIIKPSIPEKDNVYGSLTPIQQSYIQNGILVGCQIFSIYKVFSRQDYMKIVDFSLNHLLEMLLDFNKVLFDNDLNFNVMTKQQKNEIINNIYNATVVNTGEGCINVDNSNLIGGNSNVTISNEVATKIKELLNQIESLEKKVDEDEHDMAQYIFEIKQELESKMPQPAILKRALRALKTLKTIATEKAIEYGIDQLILLL